MMLEHYSRAFESLPAALQTAARKTALGHLLHSGLPTVEQEDWKYTDLAAPLAAFVPPAARGQIQGVPPAGESYGDGVDALNAAFAEQGVDVLIKGSAATLDLGFEPSKLFGPQFLHRRNRVRVAPQAQVMLLLQSRPQQIEAGDAFATLFTELELADNASATLIRIQDEAPNRVLVERLNARLGRNARLTVVSIDLGGKLVRNDTNIRLEAEGAEVQLHGLYAPAGNTHVDNHTRIEHCAPHCLSREFFRGVVGESAHAVFNGKIVVHEGARKTDSEQRVANLLLSPKAVVNAKPELEIYNDDVKCAHGATFGQLDEDAVFYLRSRGLDREAARSLLTYTFAYRIIEKIPQEDLRRSVQEKFLARLPNGALLRELL